MSRYIDRILGDDEIDDAEVFDDDAEVVDD
jgi:hypothetical protein